MRGRQDCCHGWAGLLVLGLAWLGMVPGALSQGVTNATHVARARILYEQGIVLEAVKELEMHVRSTPDDVEAHMLLSRLLAQVGHDERAASILAHVLYLDPGNAEAERLLTRMRNYLGQQVDHSNPDAVLQYARISARPGSYARAATFYRKALALVDSTAVHLEFARMLSWAEAYAESAFHYDIVLARTPAALDVMREAGRVMNALGNFARAIEILQGYRQRRPEDTGALLELTWALVWSGRAEEGRHLLRDVIRLEPDRLDILLVQGSLAELENRILDAYAFYREALERAPGHPEVLRRITHLERGNGIEIARLQARVAAAAEDMDAHLALAVLLEGEERYGEAITLLERANRRLPEHEGVYRALRGLRARDSERVQARLAAFRATRAVQQQAQVDRLQAWLVENPRDVRTRMELTRLFYDAGQYPEALAELQILQHDAPMDPLVLEMLNAIMTREQDRARQENRPEGRLLQ